MKGTIVTYKRLTANQRNFVETAAEAGCTSPITRPEVLDVCDQYDISIPQWLVGPRGADRRIGRGVYDLPELSEFGQDGVGETPVLVSTSTPVPVAPVPMTTMALAPDIGSLIPEKISTYVPFGHFKDVERIVKSKRFYPCFITGLSGNGKTTMVEQVSSKTKRPLFRVNITAETDEDDLLGGFRLINGDTVWQDGPVVQAMKQGAILLLDEIDLASVKVMCLQPVLEGKGVFLKKTGVWVTPAAGFTVFATANTKGKGDAHGRFIGTNVLNEAFLDRFPVTLEQDYPSPAQERKMLTKRLDEQDTPDDEFAENLVKWAQIVRKSFHEGAVDEIITTRRLINVCEAFGIFGDKGKSIDLAISRFDEDTKEAFLSLYGKIDEEVDPSDPTAGSARHTDATPADDAEKCPF